MTLEEFRAHLNSYVDVAKSDRFRVTIQPPNLLLGKYGDAARKLTFQCEQAELPGKTLQFFEVRSYGPSQRFPFQTAFNELFLSFICTANPEGLSNQGLWEKQFFEDWLELINPGPNSTDKGKWNIEYKNNYKSTLTVEHFDTMGNVNQTINFIDAYPFVINPMTIAWSDDSALRMSISFTYNYWLHPDLSQNDTQDIISTTPKPNLSGNTGPQFI